MPLLEASSSKSLDQFGTCFTQIADRASRAWAYLPSERGGTFTDSGARGASASYWLQVHGARGATQLRLFSTTRATEIREAIDRCR